MRLTALPPAERLKRMVDRVKAGQPLDDAMMKEIREASEAAAARGYARDIIESLLELVERGKITDPS
jgi:hypothetical protein